MSQTYKLKCEVASLSSKAFAKSCDGEILAGGSADKKVNCSIIILSDGGEVPVAGDGGVVVREDAARCIRNL